MNIDQVKTASNTPMTATGTVGQCEMCEFEDKLTYVQPVGELPVYVCGICASNWPKQYRH